MKPEKANVYRAYETSGNLFECMYFDESITNWGSITTNFVMEQNEGKEGKNL